MVFMIQLVNFKKGNIRLKIVNFRLENLAHDGILSSIREQ